MKIRLLSAVVFSFALGAAACAQNPNPATPASQDNGGGTGNGGGGFGQRAGRGGFGGMGMGMGGGRGLTGTVTEVGTEHYTVKTAGGEIYTVHFSANTRIVKMPAGMRGPGGGGQGAGGGQGRGGGYGQRGGQGGGGGQGRGGGYGQRGGQGGGMGGGGNPPEQIKATDIKVGDAIGAMGEVDTAAKSMGATIIVQLDPERARQMMEMQANYGKTWIQGKVTAIDGVKVTVMGAIDNAAHAFVADENTTFRKRRDPITLADIQVGDTVRAEGALKDGIFAAVNVMVVPQGEAATVPRNPPPQ